MPRVSPHEKDVGCLFRLLPLRGVRRMVGTMGRRFLVTWRLTAMAVILFGPIAMAHWELRQFDRRVGDPAPEKEAEYRARRNPVIDELLPSGQGGVRIVKSLDDRAGVAFTGSATIALAASVGPFRRVGWACSA